MKKYLYPLLVLLLSLPLYVSAQQKTASISFNETVYDFGDIKESDGNVSHSFDFTNTGSEPLIIQNVTPSCGCTTPTWTKEPVMPGEKGYIKAVFNPSNRPGHFDKYITVQSNASQPSVRLRITGKVEAKPLTIEDEYRYQMGNLRLKSNHVSFGTVYKGQPQTQLIDYINDSDKPLTLEAKNVPAHLAVKIDHPTLKPHEKGTIEVTYLSNKQPDWDFLIDRFDLYINGETDRTYKLIVSANVQEDFSSMSQDQLAKAPEISFTDKNFDFGKLVQGESVNHEFTFVNKGKTDLMIRKVHASCGCTAAMISSEVVKPGQSGSIKVTFNSSGKLGNQNKTVTVITNDPQHAREILWIRGEVTQEKEEQETQIICIRHYRSVLSPSMLVRRIFFRTKPISPRLSYFYPYHFTV